MTGGFHPLDWGVLGGYFLLLAVTGARLNRRQRSVDDYFRAGGAIPTLAAAVSFLATALSAATFIGGPQQAYRGDLTYLSANIGSILAVFIVAFLFVPAYFRERTMTVYGLLGKRFGAGAMRASAGAYLVGRVFAGGARLYIAALPSSLIVFGDLKLNHQATAIVVLTIIGITYTLIGGIRSVIWTDLIQTIIFVGAAIISAAVLMNRIPASMGEMIDALRHPVGGTSKLTILRVGLDGFAPQHTYTLLTALFGFTLLNLGAYGTDQDMAQRMLTCRNAVAGGRSAIAAILIGLPVTALFMGLGLLLYIFYQRPDLMGASAVPAPDSSREVFLTFIINELPPGLTGLMMAGLFAAALSTLNSGLNSMSSSLIADFYQPLRPGRGDRHYLMAGRLGVALFGIILGGFAYLSAVYQEAHPETTLIDFALSVMVFAYSGLNAVFLTALLTKTRGSVGSVIAALLSGFATVLFMQWRFADELAFPWQLTIANTLALGVCLMGRSRQGTTTIGTGPSPPV